jgi:hypothetical protein
LGLAYRVRHTRHTFSKGNEVAQEAAKMELDPEWIQPITEFAERCELDPWWCIFTKPIPALEWRSANSALDLPANFKPLVLGRDLQYRLLLFTNIETAFGVPSWDQVATSRDRSVAIRDADDNLVLHDTHATAVASKMEEIAGDYLVEIAALFSLIVRKGFYQV